MLLFQVLDQQAIDNEKIAAFVFDTTAINQHRFEKWHNSQTGTRVWKVCVAARLQASYF